jgi:hypothetical protein
MYVENQQSNNREVVGSSTYRDIFSSKFNIGFHHPKKDACAVCEKYKNSTRDEKMAMQADYDEHLLLKQEARDLKKEHKTLARSNVQFHACCFDLQQVLQCPYGANSLFYYRRKLDLYNLSVYDLATGKAKCFIWDQMQAKRGANEIGSCLHRYLTGLSEEGIREVVMYADNCGGQNKNQFIVAMMLHAVQHTEIEKLTICYLEAGHTQNENDSVHSSIGLAKKKSRKNICSYPICRHC